MKKQLHDDIGTKEFKLLVPFRVKEMDMGEEDGSGESLTIEGYANWFGEDVGEDGDGVACDLAGEAVVPSGIDLSVYKGNPQILWQHDRHCPVGKANKTVRKKEGLFVNATIFKGAMEEEDWFRVKNGLVTRFSIGFRCLAGEYKEVSGKNIFFITKSLLLEISLVTIPCSSESAFRIIKSLGDGTFLSLQEDTPQPAPTEDVLEHQETTKTEDDNTMKLTLKELLTEAEVAHLTALGLQAELESEKEVSTKAYIDLVVQKRVDGAVAELRAEIESLKAAQQVFSTEETSEEEVEETKDETGEEQTETEADLDTTKTDGEETTDDIDVEIKSLQEDLDKLKALLSDEK